MRERCRYPFTAIVFMALICAVIGVVMLKVGMLAQYGRTFMIILVAGTMAAAVVTAVLLALRRAGVNRLSQLRTWPQN